MSDAGDPVGAETGGDVTPFSDNPDIRKRFGIKQDTARQTTVSSSLKVGKSSAKGPSRRPWERTAGRYLRLPPRLFDPSAIAGK
jgi:hypothetical protein